MTHTHTHKKNRYQHCINESSSFTWLVRSFVWYAPYIHIRSYTMFRIHLLEVVISLWIIISVVNFFSSFSSSVAGYGTFNLSWHIIWNELKSMTRENEHAKKYISYACVFFIHHLLSLICVHCSMVAWDMVFKSSFYVDDVGRTKKNVCNFQRIFQIFFSVALYPRCPFPPSLSFSLLYCTSCYLVFSCMIKFTMFTYMENVCNENGFKMDTHANKTAAKKRVCKGKTKPKNNRLQAYQRSGKMCNAMREWRFKCLEHDIKYSNE